MTEKYVSPICEQLELMLEGAILSSSSEEESLGIFEDNDIFNEIF